MIIKTLTNMINRKFFLVILSLTMLSLCSCEKVEEEPLGIRTPMKWEKTNYQQTEDNGKQYYVVSPEGGTLKFNCTNYKGLLLERIIDESEMNSLYPNNNMTTEEMQNVVESGSFTSDVCDVTIDNSSVEITFKPNSSESRKINVSVFIRDIFHTFNFIQDGNQE